MKTLHNMIRLILSWFTKNVTSKIKPTIVPTSPTAIPSHYTRTSSSSFYLSIKGNITMNNLYKFLKYPFMTLFLPIAFIYCYLFKVLYLIGVELTFTFCILSEIFEVAYKHILKKYFSKGNK